MCTPMRVLNKHFFVKLQSSAYNVNSSGLYFLEHYFVYYNYYILNSVSIILRFIPQNGSSLKKPLAHILSGLRFG